jgi:glycosyltransferase involved in cell wall biosynthesis
MRRRASLAVPRLRVLLSPSAYLPNVGGIEELTRQLALALGARGHEVAVVTNRWPSASPRKEIIDGVAVSRLRFPLPASQVSAASRFLFLAPPAAVAFIRAIRAWKPDVLHVIGAGPQSVYAATLNRTLASALVFTGQGELAFDAADVFGDSATLRAGLRRMLTRADAVTACSNYVLEGLENFTQMRNRAEVVPNGVDPTEGRDARPEGRLGAYALSVGRLVPQKGVDVLIDAFDSPELANLSLVVAGDGIERSRLEARARGLGNRVRFVGAVDRGWLARLLAGAHVFALPSRAEPFGIALLEAMAAGVPSVATAAGGVPEFAEDGHNALLVPVDDTAALARALGRAARDQQLRERLTAGGRATAATLAWSRIAERYEAIYFRCLS